MLQYLLDDPVIRVGSKIPYSLLCVLQILQRMPDVLVGVRSAQMRNEQLQIRVVLLDLEQLALVHRVGQPARPGNVQLHDPLVPVCNLQMLFGQEIVDPDLVRRNIGR